MKILIADDSSTIRNVLKNRLHELGVENISLVNDGEDAWEAIEKEKNFNVLFTDYHMPQMDGLELIKKVRNEGFNEIFIVLLRGVHSNDKTTEEFLSNGVNSILEKPFSLTSVKESIIEILD